MDRATVMPEPIKPLNKFLPDVCRTADILVVAVGHPELASPAAWPSASPCHGDERHGVCWHAPGVTGCRVLSR